MSSLDNTVVELSKLAISTNNTIVEIPIDLWFNISNYVTSTYPIMFLSKEINLLLKEEARSWKLYKKIQEHYGYNNLHYMHQYGLIKWTLKNDWSEFSKLNLKSNNKYFNYDTSTWSVNYTRLDLVNVVLTHNSVINNLLKKLVWYLNH